MSQQFLGAKVTVVGLARSGIASAELLLQHGAQVRITEQHDTPQLRAAADRLSQRGAQVELGRHSLEWVEGQELLVVSPGVPAVNPLIQWAQARRLPVISELELASRLCPCDVVAITGSNGKSTVTTLIGEILTAAGRHAVVCGNVGLPFASVLGQLRPDSIACVEVSSFQLEHVETFRPRVSVLLNLTPNHLERHGSFEAYVAMKSRIFRQQGRWDKAVFNGDDLECVALLSSCRAPGYLFSRQIRVEGVCLDQGWLTLTHDGQGERLIEAQALALPGAIGIENALAASLAASLLGAPVEAIREALQTFGGLPHRFEPVATIRGIRWINDSKATTPEAAMKAMESCPGPVVLIAGGRMKGCDYRKVVPALKEKVRVALLVGEAQDELARLWGEAARCLLCGTLEEAVRQAVALAEAGEAVLLSPMCASFDQFKDFEERGDRFKALVKDLERPCVASVS